MKPKLKLHPKCESEYETKTDTGTNTEHETETKRANKTEAEVETGADTEIETEYVTEATAKTGTTTETEYQSASETGQVGEPHSTIHGHDTNITHHVCGMIQNMCGDIHIEEAHVQSRIICAGRVDGLGMV